MAAIFISKFGEYPAWEREPVKEGLQGVVERRFRGKLEKEELPKGGGLEVASMTGGNRGGGSPFSLCARRQEEPELLLLGGVGEGGKAAFCRERRVWEAALVGDNNLASGSRERRLGRSAMMGGVV